MEPYGDDDCFFYGTQYKTMLTSYAIEIDIHHKIIFFVASQ